MNLFASQLAATIKINAERPALIDGASQLTISFSQLGQRLEELGTIFSRGEQDARITVLSAMPDSLETLTLFLAVGVMGGDILVADPQMTQSELARLLSLVNVDVAFVSRSTSPGLRRSLLDAQVDVHEFESVGSTNLLSGQGHFEGKPARRDNALLIMTSGTTGEPKLLRMPFESLWSQARTFAMCHRFMGPGIRMMNSFSMSYLGGLLNGFLVPISVGGSVLVVDKGVRESPSMFWHEVRRHEVDTAWLFPTHIRDLVRNGELVDPSLYKEATGRLKAVFTGMAPISGALKSRFQELFGVPCLENYALSETGFIATEIVEALHLDGRDNAGFIMPGVQVQVADGEFSARTPYAFSGYVTSGGAVENAAPYFATGDIGEVDRYGRIVLKGRSKEVIKRADQLIYLREIELMVESSDAVARCAAARVEEEGSESYDLFIERRDQTYPFASIVSWLHSVLPTGKWPRSIHKMDEMPISRSGKIRKGALQHNGAL